MLRVATYVRAVLVPFLILTGSLLAGLLVTVLILHGARELACRRRQHLIARYQPLVDALLQPDLPPGTIQRLKNCPARHRPILSGLLLAPLRVASGLVIDRVRLAAEAVGLIDAWTNALSDRRWWVRADAARALGCVREVSAVSPILAMLDDDHEEVRAAAVEALGLIGDVRTIAALVSRLPEQSRYQRARVVEALRAFGPSVVKPLLAHSRGNPEDMATIADLLGLVRAVSAVDDLTGWCTDGRPEVRAAALRALGTIGPSERSYYYALRALRDEVAEVRAMAARALGRSRRQDAAPYLATALDDEWIVAAHCARGLRDLGAAGRLELERVSHEGQALHLARQMLWEQDRQVRASHA